MTSTKAEGGLPECFRLKPIKAAKVSEISEAVASSAIEPEERVNFHIGNPATDPGLISTFEKILFQEKVQACKSDHTELIKKAIRKCVPYAPGGGFKRKEPNSLALLVQQWLAEMQQEPLDYSLGQTSGKREIIFQSGGIYEAIRIFFRSLSSYLVHLPARIITWGFTLPEHLKSEKGLDYISLNSGIDAHLDSLKSLLSEDSSRALFLILGRNLKEEERRELRRICLNSNLIIIEANNAANHLSVAREAGLLDRVIRFIEPAAVHPSLQNLSIIFTAGNSTMLQIMEAVHFELKGTPSVSEMILTSYLMSDLFEQPGDDGQNNAGEDSGVTVESGQLSELTRVSQRLTDLSEKAEGRYLAQFEENAESKQNKIEKYQKKLSGVLDRWTQFQDPFQNISVAELVEWFFAKYVEPEFAGQLITAHKAAFTSVHPEYKPENCRVVSGSARTALSILGFHCGIDEVIAPDLGWTYQHCFEKVSMVPLGSNLSLDSRAILDKVQQRLESDPEWRSRGAVILNSPHNASGKVYSPGELKPLLKQLLSQRVMVVDDLSYENIHPREELAGEGTMRQITEELIASGQLKGEHGDYLITVHSLSKTDCFAGARLAVIEIRIEELAQRFSQILRAVTPNIFAILISYLFYRNGPEAAAKFWLRRNGVFTRRMQALDEAMNDFPRERNSYNLKIVEPQGSMYPRLEIDKLPQGLSLEWLSSGLATRGIGLVPLSTFSHTEQGYELARKSFRLSLGGSDSHDTLRKKMRKVLIDLNRLIASESAQYKSHFLKSDRNILDGSKHELLLAKLTSEIREASLQQVARQNLDHSRYGVTGDSSGIRWREHLESRIKGFADRLRDKLILNDQMLISLRQGGGAKLEERLEREFYRDSLGSREQRFKERLYDRTVHPTQMYSLAVDMLVLELEEQVVCSQSWDTALIARIAHELVKEFTGHSVSISSRQEADEVSCDLSGMIHAEEWAYWMTDTELPTLLSFWGDWDGSTRPSGQGHRLVASVLQDNISEMADLVDGLVAQNSRADFSADLLSEIGRFKKQRSRFRVLLDDITDLTQLLEKRYQGLLPSQMQAGFLRKIGMAMRITKDPLSSIFEHNDRLEKRMETLKSRRREQLEYFFALNKSIRKELHANIPHIGALTRTPEAAMSFARYRDKLKRFVLTPRIHQKTIQDIDSFTIDRTVENILELNDISGSYGNPGMVMALQVSMSTTAGALIDLDRKFLSGKKKVESRKGGKHLPGIRLVPLFEEDHAVNSLEAYLDKIWNYCQTTKDMDSSTNERFSDMICELFVAGSDLSQQLSQPAGASLYKQAKYTATKWLATRGLAECVRIKLGSGEPMQRQGGYYNVNSGKNTLFMPGTRQTDYWLKGNLKESARRAMVYARSPLNGVMAGGEFRTLQSNVSEKLRQIPDSERANLLHHIWRSKANAEEAIGRAARTMIHTRLNTESKEIKDLERMTKGQNHPISKKFTDLTSRYFRQILYGSQEDLVGIHTASYFISRTTPPLRDRPVVRPSSHSGLNKSRQVVDQLSSVVPLAKHGSMLRAIGHNRAQTVVLGVNQLTTGLFRAMTAIVQEFSNKEEGSLAISDKIMPTLPVREILQTLRIYQDRNLKNISELEGLFPAASSAFHILREDNAAIDRFIPLLQKELVRKQGLKPSDFFEGNFLKPELLPLFRPDLAVLLQKDIFNFDIEGMLQEVSGPLHPAWREEVEQHLSIPSKVAELRAKIWQLIKQPLAKQVKSFVKVAAAVCAISRGQASQASSSDATLPAIVEMASSIKKSLSSESDESMQNFLSAAVNFLSGMAGDSGNTPVEVIRVLRDVKQILSIDEQALDSKEQELFNFYLLEVARITGENG